MLGPSNYMSKQIQMFQERMLALGMGFDTVWTAACGAVLSKLHSRDFDAGFGPILLQFHRWVLL